MEKCAFKNHHFLKELTIQKSEPLLIVKVSSLIQFCSERRFLRLRSLRSLRLVLTEEGVCEDDLGFEAAT